MGEGGERSSPGEGLRRSYYAPPTPDSRPPTPDASSGNRLVRQAAEHVQAERAISADLRYRIDAFGHQLLGLGTYRQLGQGSEKLLRLELKIQVADQAVTRQEICGPQYYWVRRESPFTPSSLGRVSLRQVRQATSRAPDPVAANPGEVWMMLGGLPKLLAALERNFDFDEAKEDELLFRSAEGEAIDRQQVLIVRGKWKPERLAALTETDKPPVGSALRGVPAAPEQIPDEVELVLGRTDQSLPLFPYRITWFKRSKGEGKGGEPLRNMLTMELFNVFRNDQLDPREFDYQPGDQEVADLTGVYLQRLGLGTKTR